MTDENQPIAPESLPNYLADGLPKQSNKTLRDVIAYAEELIEYNDRPVEIPDNAEPVEDADSGGKGTLVKEKVKCGTDSCHCNDGELHGPYLYRYYRNDSGSLTSEYVGKPN